MTAVRLSFSLKKKKLKNKKKKPKLFFLPNVLQDF